MGEVEDLEKAKLCLEAAIEFMKEAIGFDQLASGYGAETYEETLENIIEQVSEYQDGCR